MKARLMKLLILNTSIVFFFSTLAFTQSLEDFTYKGALNPAANYIKSDFQFNGYTNHWHNIYRDEIRYGNLFKQSIPDVQLTIAQSKLDIADDMQIPGLNIQEGFIYNLLLEDYIILDQSVWEDGVIREPILLSLISKVKTHSPIWAQRSLRIYAL